MTRHHVGIDLGTTYCCVHIYDEKRHIVSPILDGSTSQIPSYVSYCGDNILYGAVAMNQILNNTKYTVYDSKRMIGKKFDNKDFQIDRKNWMFETVRGANNSININIEYKGKIIPLAPEEISGHILRYLKNITEKTLTSGECSDVVVTVPAAFDSIQREKTILAAKEIAGFKHVALLDEPSAAALEYAQGLPKHTQEKVLIFDFGGGTLDISIVDINQTECRVVKTKGNPHFGGQDIDKILVGYFKDDFEKQNNVKIDMSTKEGQMAMMLLKIECEKLKRNLSNLRTANFTLNKFYQGFDLNAKLTKRNFEKRISGFLEKAKDLIEETLNEAKLQPDDISQIILVGGSSQIPAVGELIENYFDKKPMQSIKPLEVVSRGACLQCYNLHCINGFEPQHEINGIEEISEDSSSSTPPRSRMTFSAPAFDTTNHEIEDVIADQTNNQRERPNRQVRAHSHSDHDEEEDKPKPTPRMVHGRQIKLVEKVSLSFGIREENDIFSKIIPSGVVIPAKEVQTYCTTVDYQEFMDIAVFQGENRKASENSFLGMFTISDFPKRKAGKVEVAIEMTIDRSGILTLNASVENKKVKYVFNKELGTSEQELDRIRNNLAVVRNPKEEFEKLASRLPLLGEKIKKKCREESNKNAEHNQLRKNVFNLIDDVQDEEDPSPERINELVENMESLMREIYSVFPELADE
ncbi:dnaK protein [Trichomonas vaginalis G3]|uniref:DnaK protein n=1 Tax=Trichomonas vaginalis (strain ATCC PRA-98 / G3) TaxID=412133 RepID=A2E407_TRIV3|nr:unfolded protein binding [Trichomonas vaginalis G3]EAY12662.1 dnaK protein [Trichomonas vaginalis G3]KAI5547024.1 unfolded protein binding [Trichomonas vaginalis G3]|eukprot:XP_001324885.1 dnaK protein [Trichomonas vaginalis G3]